jgi:hypothetical protein
MRAAPLAATLALALLFGTHSASAQDHEQDAERLFREGQKLLEERRFGEACPKFEAAYTKDHSLGTLINLAFCHKEQGATWYAWLEFREAEVKATELNRADRRDFAHQRLAELEKLLPKLVIDNPQKVPLTDVLVEDRKVFEAERSAVFAAEAGERRFTFKAKGKKPAATLITVAKGDKLQHVTVPEMEDAPAERPAGAEHPADPKHADAAATSDPGSTQRTLGWVALGVAGVAALIGTIEGVSTFSSACHGGKACTDEERDSANGSGTVADISFVVAILAAGGGVYLLMTAPPAPSASPAAAARARIAPPTSARASSVSVTPHLGLGWASVSGTF